MRNTQNSGFEHSLAVLLVVVFVVGCHLSAVGGTNEINIITGYSACTENGSDWEPIASSSSPSSIPAGVAPAFHAPANKNTHIKLNFNYTSLIIRIDTREPMYYAATHGLWGLCGRRRRRCIRVPNGRNTVPDGGGLFPGRPCGAAK